MPWYKHTPTVHEHPHSKPHRATNKWGRQQPPQSAFFCNPSLNEVQECVEHSKSEVFEVPGFLHFKTSHDPPPKPYLSPTTALESLLVHQLSRDFKAGREGADRQQDKISHTSSRQSSDPNPSGKSGGGTLAPGFILLKSKWWYLEGLHWASSAAVPGWCWGEALGMLNLGTNGTNAAWEPPSPRAPPWERHSTHPAADTIHQEFHNWFVWWSFGSCTNCCWCFFFFKEEFSQSWNAAEISHRKWKPSRKKVWEVVKGQQNWNLSKRSDCTQLGAYSRYNWPHLERDFPDPAESKFICFWIFHEGKPQGNVI